MGERIRGECRWRPRCSAARALAQVLGLRADLLRHALETSLDRHSGFDSDQQPVEGIGKRAFDRELPARDLVLDEQHGQVHAERSYAALPSPISALAIRTSVVSSRAAGDRGGGGDSDRPASRAAMPPAARAMTSTMIRAGVIRTTSYITLQPDTWSQL